MKKILFLLVVSFFINFSLKAQELDAEVVINYEQLPTGGKERLDNFKYQVQDYLNNNKFTGQAWDGDKIKCNFNIFFTGWGSETSYTAQLVVSSQRPIEGSSRSSLMLSLLDNKWSFTYEKNQAMYFNQTDFDPLVSFLDYYAYIIIGFDMDSYYKLGGSDYFSKALEIAVRGGSSKFSDGWQSESTSYNRRGLVDNLLNAKYQQLRMDVFDYHYNGIDLINDPQNQQTAYNNIVKLVNNLFKAKDQLDARSVYLKVFFDAKAGEMAEYLKNYPGKENVVSMLKKIDPAHTTKYEEALK
jgi:hypothetical protein